MDKGTLVTPPEIKRPFAYEFPRYLTHVSLTPVDTSDKLWARSPQEKTENGCSAVGSAKGVKSGYVENAPIVHADRFLYNFADYTNRQVARSDARKMYLDRYRGLTVMVIWSPACQPCIEDFPKFNELYQRFSASADFVGVIMRKQLEVAESEKRRASELEMEINLNRDRFMRGGFAAFGGQSFFGNLMGKLSNEKFGRELAALHRYSLFESERVEFGISIDTLADGGNSLLFSNTVLDNESTRTYLKKGFPYIPYIVLLKDGEIMDGRLPSAVAGALKSYNATGQLNGSY